MALLQQVCKAMDRLAPLSLAERSWDNVGVLIEAPLPRPRASKVLLTIDLTEPVLEEALDDDQVGVIVAYHPVLFRPFKSILLTDTKQRIAAKCISAGISVYSPHTALDNVPGGINDWLCSGLGNGKVSTISPTDSKIVSSIYGSEYRNLISNASIISKSPISSSPSPLEKLPSNINTNGISSLARASLASISRFDSISSSLPVPGSGRILSLDDEAGIPLDKLVDIVKKHLGLKYVRVAIALPHKLGGLNVRTVAVCAGSGSSVLSNVAADVYLTGEMSHHEVLSALERGTSVILCEHTNTERGYLPTLKANLTDLFNCERELCPIENAVVEISVHDKDPLEIL